MTLTSDILGYVGGGILAIQHVPLTWRIWKRRTTDDLSYLTLMFFGIGAVLTIIYAIMIHAIPLYATITFSLFMNLIVLCMKIYFDFFERSRNMQKYILPVSNSHSFTTEELPV